MTFIELGLRQELLDGIELLGFTEPTPIQIAVIPFILEEERDLVALAQTGTGKTGAFGWPILEKIDPQSKKTQALILCPTRELCIQIAHDLRSFSKKLPDVRTLALYGGADIRPQLDGLDRGAQIIVATPGRLLDLMRTRKAKLFAVERLVLDEADEMLNMGFEEDLNTILDEVPHTAQRLLFSATMPQRVQRMMHNYMNDPHEITIGERNTLSELVEHQFLLVHAKDHYAGLRRVLDATPEMYGLIFCRTKADTQLISDRLNNDGFRTAALHGDLLHEEREAVMKQFRAHQVKLVVATDVAARGLHINDLTHVIHYTIPDDQNTYTHRSGRTGRAGKRGISLVIIHAREKFKLERIENILGQTFGKRRIPTGDVIGRIQLQHLIKQSVPSDTTLEEVSAQLDTLATSDEIDPQALKSVRKTVDFYRATSELSREPEKVKPRKKNSGSISGREAREQHVPREMTEGMIELVVNIGKRNELTEESLSELINTSADRVGGTTIPLGKINIVEMQTYFEVPYPRSHEIINHFKEPPIEFAGRPINIAFAGNAKPVESKKPKPRGGKGKK
ncbi:DEAD/DEAH box helicase [Pontiellaceae bacterium B1224]|nr:DEAD/DEAH box helicase [Pontiellaceae bacterium B1224]